MRVAAIDCGTNSFRLLVADASDDRPVPVHREMRIVRLGENVDRTGVLAPGALTRARAVLADYGSVIRGLGVDRIRLVATSATRDAANRDAFAAIVGETIGVTPEIVSGVEEATLSFTGAVDTLPEVKGPVLLVDLGGGSTELVLGGGKYQRLRAYSMDMGSVRLTERHLHDDPPTFGQVVVTVADVRVSLEIASEHVPLDTGATLVGVAGTITTLAAIALGLEEYDSAAIHGSRLSAEQISEITDELILLDHDGRAAIPVIHPGRVDVIVAGALILRTIMEATGAPEIVVSEHDILDGIALSLLS